MEVSTSVNTGMHKKFELYPEKIISFSYYYPTLLGIHTKLFKM